MESDREAAHGEVVSLLASKDAEIAALAARVTELEGLVAALQAQLGRDSSNSGKPPSSDSPFTKKPAAKRSSRTRPGKQPGAPSATLRLIDDPDDTITHTPPVCAGCSDDLADAEVFGVCRRQVFDVPPHPPRPYVIEHWVQSRTCGGCGTVTEATAPGVASGRVQYGPAVKARAAWLTCVHFLPVRRARRVLKSARHMRYVACRDG
jgi:transposase